eukprot:TRINITY_DN980_c1_g1_i1.p4 TRINITY_DN980_c1_g1~~TRINITY_DN980_c1_g1_i1.p4  ORF type:complete len:53 (+),score=5.22 TRINITY_DN980_c1_g1_i1:143-301(+)
MSLKLLDRRNSDRIWRTSIVGNPILVLKLLDRRNSDRIWKTSVVASPILEFQ